jgi:F-type H+-transporting ATPase subunit epsilon
MAVQAIQLRVLTRAGVALEDKAISVIAPGAVGYVGFLRNHAPLVTTLRPGKLTWTQPGGAKRSARVGEGLLEIAHNRLTLLVSEIRENNSTASRAI